MIREPVPTIAILGPGGVGGFVAAALARSGQEVTVVAGEDTAATIAADGIVVESAPLGSFEVRPRATASLREAVDVLLIATKATTLDTALERIPGDPRLVVPLLNGLDHMSILRAWFGAARVAAGVIRIESNRVAAGRIVQTSPSVRVDLASDLPSLRSPLHQLAAALERAGIPVELGSTEAQILWSKLIRLCALALTTSASDRPIGFIRSDPRWRAQLAACVFEATAVANADGARIDPADRIDELDAAHAELESSMRRDIVASREPELDAIAGSVLRAAARHGLECPTIAGLTAQVAARAGLPRPAVCSGS